MVTFYSTGSKQMMRARELEVTPACTAVSPVWQAYWAWDLSLTMYAGHAVAL